MAFAAGANLSYASESITARRIFKLMTFKRGTGTWPKGKICRKAGAPANNTAADNPNALYDLLLDTTDSRVYVCTLWSANASATTWTRIV